MDKKKVFLAGGLLLLFFIALSFWNEVLRAGILKITFFDVGQGDAAFVRTPQGKQIIVDGGPDSTVVKKLAQEIPFWDTSIDMVILSHPAQDHMAGLLDVFKKYRVQTILWTGVEKDTEIFQEWKRALNQETKEGAVVILSSGPERMLLEKGPCPQYMDILSPLESMAGKLVENDNDTSLVVRFHSCGTAVLFTGDLTQKGERALLDQNIFLDSDILKVGHHGSRTSSSPEFVEAISPIAAVISSGKENMYGHPTKETLATLARYGIEIRRTDEEGDIVFKFK